MNAHPQMLRHQNFVWIVGHSERIDMSEKSTSRRSAVGADLATVAG
jgi:hypothetical protein